MKIHIKIEINLLCCWKSRWVWQGYNNLVKTSTCFHFLDVGNLKASGFGKFLVIPDANQFILQNESLDFTLRVLEAFDLSRLFGFTKVSLTYLLNLKVVNLLKSTNLNDKSVWKAVVLFSNIHLNQKHLSRCYSSKNFLPTDGKQKSTINRWNIAAKCDEISFLIRELAKA